LFITPDNTGDLKLSGLPITDLSCLAGIPLSGLDVTMTKIRSLEPLRGMPLKHLDAGNTQIDDLRPLAGMPLIHLNLQITRVRDLSPLKGMKLRVLYLEGVGARDFSPLKGMPLDDFRGPGGNDNDELLVSLLADMPLGHSLYIPNTRHLTDIAFLKNKPLVWSLTLSGTMVANLSPLTGKRIRHINLADTQVRDLSPLRDVNCYELNLAGTPITDLSSLAGSEFNVLDLGRCINLRDVSPLAQCSELRRLRLPPGVTGVEKLRNHPKLEKLTFAPALGFNQVPPIAEFWKAYDAQKGKKK
jgi:Leucine-rich repeat (LRR) protein